MNNIKVASHEESNKYYKNLREESFKGLPPEFVTYISVESYDRGHSAGESEVDMIAASMAIELKPVIEAYTKRIRSSGWQNNLDGRNK